MQDVREVLRRPQTGQSARRTGREMGLDRKTVGRYLVQAAQQGCGAETPVTDAVAAAVGRGVQARPAPAPQPDQRLAGGERPLRRVRIHELLARDGVAVGHTTLRRFVCRERGWGRRAPTARLSDPPPGQEAQSDFGLMGHVPTGDGKLRRLWALIVTLSSARVVRASKTDPGLPSDPPAVRVVDTGATRGHPRLEGALAASDCHACEPTWGAHDHHGHGTQRAGLALFGDLVPLLAASHPVRLRHVLESVKILPPHGVDPPERYGRERLPV